VSTPTVQQPVPPDEALAWEAAERKRSGSSGLIAAVLTLIGSIGLVLVFTDSPHVVVTDALRDAVGASPPGSTGLKTDQILYYNDHAPALIAVAVALALGSAAMSPILGYLYRAAAARTPKLPRLALYAALIGPLVVAVATLGLQIVSSVQASDFAGSADHSTKAAHDALTGSTLLAFTLMRQLGVLVVGLAFVLISLHGMRVGLFTRFIGILGMLAGVLFVIPLVSLPVVQCFWLGVVSLLVLQRWPGPVPPSWKTGEPEPWPTQQQVREQRARDKEALESGVDEQELRSDPRAAAPSTPAPLPRPGGGAGSTASDGESDKPVGKPHSSSKKKKRKRR
jgi:hypothetical protein